MLAQLIQFFMPSRHQQSAAVLYQAVTEAARQPTLYAQWHVPDSVDGRFDMIVLHMFLVVRHIRAQAGAAAKQAEQNLMEVMFADMDRSLREMGATDTGVGRRVRAMAEAFYGRQKAYEIALSDAEDAAALAQSLRRNVYGTVQDVRPQDVDALARYVRASEAALQTQEIAAILEGQIYSFILSFSHH
jgi:cytochrome b pre-mRNA-processing protein 3